MGKRWELLAILQLALVAADIQVYHEGQPFILAADFLLAEANFGDIIPLRGISVYVTMADPPNACGPIKPPPSNVLNPHEHWAVLIKRYNCTFEEKVLYAQSANYDVAIVHNVDSNKLEIMNVSDPDKINIISVFITANAGREIANKYLYDKGYYLGIVRSSSTDFLNKILLPFLVIVSICFVLMSGFMVLKCIKDYRRARRRRMPCSSLNKIPIAKFRKNDPFETCAICLEDFIEGEKLRILPCSHAYHTKCIDPWLTRNRRVCPMCKRKVFAADESRAESDLSSSDDDDNTPLLRGSNQPQNTSYGGTNTNNQLSTRILSSSQIPVEERSQLIEAIRAHRARVLAALELNASDGDNTSNSSSTSSSQATHSEVGRNSDAASAEHEAGSPEQNPVQVIPSAVGVHTDRQGTNEDEVVVLESTPSKCRIS